jgi:Peptidase family S41
MSTASKTGGTTRRGGRRRRTSRSVESSDLAAPFLAAVAEPVREQLAASVELREFLRGAGALTLEERRLLVEQALVLLEQNYVHLPLKAAMHAVNPVQRLRLLRVRLERQTSEIMDPEWLFHAELSGIFHSVRDLHTNYLLPSPFAGKVAFLPFRVEEYFDDAGASHYVVAGVVEGFSAPGFGPGAEVTHWGGIPIDHAIELSAARFAGSNPAARHARGLQSLTVRPLLIHLPPDEEWVTVSYLGTDGAEHELRQAWLVTENLPPFVGDLDQVSTSAACLGVDLDADEASRARTLLFAPQVAGQAQAAEAPALTTTRAAVGEDVPTSMPGVFRARSVQTASGMFGHLRIFTFNVDDPLGFVAEFVRLVGLLPADGLILDVRGNGGGHIFASEFTLQTLTPRRIVPEPVQFIATPLNLRICRKHKDNPSGQIDLGPWFGSLDQATETGATFSAAVPITPQAGANNIGQQYEGPVVLITDARCYSATDIFSAGFQDHGIGPVLGVDDNTGAGGANVWTHGLLTNLLAFPPADAGSPYAALPKGANMRVAIRRTLRVGSLAGTPVEDLGVRPNERHRMTRRDVLEGNQDLLDRAGALLAAMPVRRLEVTATLVADGTLTVALEVSGLDRADVYVDDRPRASVDLAGGTATVTVEEAAGAGTVRVEGFSDGELVAARTVAL